MVVVTVLVFAGAAYLTGPSYAGATEVTLYKNPNCGCCQGYADYLGRNGFTVTVKATYEVEAMSRAAGIPDDFQGCHLSFIDGYVVSGHVPVGTLNKLLSERPDIKGITLPGMPMGSPGMSGTKDEIFTIYAIENAGLKVFAIE